MPVTPLRLQAPCSQVTAACVGCAATRPVTEGAWTALHQVSRLAQANSSPRKREEPSGEWWGTASHLCGLIRRLSDCALLSWHLMGKMQWSPGEAGLWGFDVYTHLLSHSIEAPS